MVEYYLEHKAMNPALVDTYAREVAASFSGIAYSQLRKFYDDVKTLERQLTDDPDKNAFAKVLPLIKLLKAKSAYAYQRSVVPDTFKEWIWDHVNRVNDIDDFRAFVLHFEAVVGFSYGFAPDKNFN